MHPDLYTLDPGRGVIAAFSDPARVFGHVATLPLLDPAFALPPRHAGGRVIACIGDAGGIAWGSAAWARFDAACARLGSALPDGPRLCLWPDAGCVLSDAPSTRSWLDRPAPPGFEVLLDPAAWITAPMRPHAPDHARRIMEQLGGHPRVAAIALPAAPGAGDALADLIADLAGAGPARPLVVAPPG